MMSKVITYHFPAFRIEYNPAKGEVATIFNDGAACLVWANDEDIQHGAAMGISAGEHKLLHELVHNMLAIAMGRETCPIVRAQALLQPMPDDAAYLEEMIMALSYMIMWKPMPYADWWKRIGWVQEYTNPFKLVDDIYDLFMYAETNGITITKQ